MDELDRKIIEILKKDASTPLSKIADMIGVPRPTVYLRFNKLKEQGVIKGFSLVLGGMDDKPVRAAMLRVKDYLLSEMGPRKVQNLGEKISRIDGVIFAAKVSRSSIFVVWKGNTFDPREYSEVTSVEMMETEVYKCP